MTQSTMPAPSVSVPREDVTCACTPVIPAMKAAEAEAAVLQFKALAHPARLRMVDLIRAHGGDLCVCEFENHFDLTQPTISHHLKVLRDAGLIRSRQDGPWVHHFVEPGAFQRLYALIERFASAEANG